MAALLSGKSACITGGVTGKSIRRHTIKDDTYIVIQALDVPSRLATSATAPQ